MDKRTKSIAAKAFSFFGAAYASYIVYRGISTGQGIEQNIYLRGVPYSEVSLAAIALFVFLGILVSPLIFKAYKKYKVAKIQREVSENRAKKNT